MARPHKIRKVSNPPLMKGFKPFGMPLCETDVLQLSFEEYESFRLVNYKQLSQDEAADQMSVSRPTLTRIYNRALKIIAGAFAEGKAIEIIGGSYYMDSDWYRCKKCYKLINGLENHIKCENCNIFSDDELLRLNAPVKS
jgi:predicted DNA-binding protein (UPF0251 family)